MPYKQQLVQGNIGRQLAKLKSPAIASLARRSLSSLAETRKAEELRGSLERLQESRVSVLAARGLAMFCYQIKGPKLTKFAFWLYRGQDLFDTRPEQAREAFLKNIVIEPRSTLTMEFLAKLYEEKLSNLPLAIHWYEKSLELYPFSKNAQIQRNRLHRIKLEMMTRVRNLS